MPPIRQEPVDLLETTGRRIEKHDADPVNKIRCYYDGQRVLLETDDSDNDKRYFVYGIYIDEVLMMYDVGGDDDYYYGHGHLYSTVVIFDDAGAVYERAEYNAYGEVTRLDPDFTAWSGTEINNPYYFTGRRRDTLDSNNFKIYYYRARYYDAETGRFVSRDPIGYADGMNLYEYVKSQPISSIDPFGLCITKTYGPYYEAYGPIIRVYTKWYGIAGLPIGCKRRYLRTRKLSRLTQAAIGSSGWLQKLLCNRLICYLFGKFWHRIRTKH